MCVFNPLTLCVTSEREKKRRVACARPCASCCSDLRPQPSMSQAALVVTLYRALMRQVDAVSRLIGPQALLGIRPPIDAHNGSFNANALAGLGYQYTTLDHLVHGLEVLPQQLPLSLPALKALIRQNFKANKFETASSADYLSQGFAALRALPQQAYLELCSSSSSSEGVVVDTTSSFIQQANAMDMGWGRGQRRPGAVSVFAYRIRITNQRDQPVRVLGRGWRIDNDQGWREAEVVLAADNAIVGQQPLIAPGACWEYVSSAHLSAPALDRPASGSMVGELLVDLLDKQQEAQERVKVPVQRFRLMAPPGTPRATASHA